MGRTGGLGKTYPRSTVTGLKDGMTVEIAGGTIFSDIKRVRPRDTRFTGILEKAKAGDKRPLGKRHPFSSSNVIQVLKKKSAQRVADQWMSWRISDKDEGGGEAEAPKDKGKPSHKVRKLTEAIEMLKDAKGTDELERAAAVSREAGVTPTKTELAIAAMREGKFDEAKNLIQEGVDELESGLAKSEKEAMAQRVAELWLSNPDR